MQYHVTNDADVLGIPLHATTPERAAEEAAPRFSVSPGDVLTVRWDVLKDPEYAGGWMVARTTEVEVEASWVPDAAKKSSSKDAAETAKKQAAAKKPEPKKAEAKKAEAKKPEPKKAAAKDEASAKSSKKSAGSKKSSGKKKRSSSKKKAAEDKA